MPRNSKRMRSLKALPFEELVMSDGSHDAEKSMCSGKYIKLSNQYSKATTNLK